VPKDIVRNYLHITHSVTLRPTSSRVFVRFGWC